MIMKIFMLIQKSPSKVRCRQTSVNYSKYIWWWWWWWGGGLGVGGCPRVSAISEKLYYFYSHVSLEKVFPPLKLTQNCFINNFFFLKHIFFLKTGNLILNWVKWEQFDVQPRLMSKKQFAILFF